MSAAIINTEEDEIMTTGYSWLPKPEHRLVDVLGKTGTFLILASPNENDYMLFKHADEATDSTFEYKGQHYRFHQAITQDRTPEFYKLAFASDKQTS